ncbi:G-type lectin S-receptor-like serine/threonine-protein kinase LECRK2 [Cinnamomum micranthum f. kanehirae]|uniref:Receptor-like serine/threonine-protein kinase n=1 Tax=Cinnamomum micranthum f. kanehirae TaxID=337451 RepID=A0A3S3N4R8_9MAGN|nr:G-type lectin S-receptor-like serine/threonine-protein kinase LECRK2 [Cinnamomum micranthum f. kanehirae]
MAHSALFDLHFLLIPLFLLATIAPSIHQSIPLGTTISAVDENSSWVSPSGEFAFGFRHLPNNDSLFLLAIWFQKIPERTVVWSANRDNPVQRESRVELVNNGHLVLYDHEGREIWKKPKAINARATSASMLDTGNLVLLSTDSSTIWESFNEPTDTILPSQTLTKPSKLSSRRSEKDYSKGQFELRLQEDGDLKLYTVPLEGEFTYSNYWSTNTAGSGSQVIFNESGYIYLTQINGNSVSLTPGNIVSTQEFYHRATLDFDGVIRQYVYPRTLDSTVGWAQSWSNVWYQPPNVCLAVFFAIGSGTCGFNSYCALDEDQRTTCHCPTGYSYLDPNNTFGGCKQDFVPQSCESGGSIEASQFELKEMRNVDWPLNDYERYFPINENLCRQECLLDCFCAVAVFKDDTCWKKKVPLGNGKMDYGVSRKTLLKTPRGNLTLQTAPPPTSSCREKKDRTALILIGSVLFGGSGLLNLLLLLAISMVLLYSRHQRKVRFQRHDASMLGIRILSFTFKELEQATNGFKEELDRGAFGAIYKGALVLESRHLIAVKMLDNVVAEGEFNKEFETEVAAIGQTHHKNLARLLGFCNEGLHQLLVYEFMSSGSLASFLFGSIRPNWNQRTQIALGIARGLVYLHEECSTQIIHCDINPQNILLDESLTPRISGFGLAKLMKADQTRSITGIRGTRGYVSPEWFKDMPITAKVDVYSFGVLLLEIICCRRNLEMGLENEERVILTDWAYDCYTDMRLDLLVENDEDAKDDLMRVERMVVVAIWCIQENPTMRPSMMKVTEMLEGVVEVSKPLNPYSTSSVFS